MNLADTPARGLVTRMRSDLDLITREMDASDQWLAQADSYGHDVEAREKCWERAAEHQRQAWRLLEATVVMGSRQVFR